MTKKLTVPVENIVYILDLFEEVNKYDLKDIEFYYNDKLVDAPKSEIEEFAYSGLTNIDFIKSREWKENKDGKPYKKEWYYNKKFRRVLEAILDVLCCLNFGLGLNALILKNYGLCLLFSTWFLIFFSFSCKLFSTRVRGGVNK